MPTTRRRASGLTVRPVTAPLWRDFARLFEARGSPHYCWCTPYRFRGAHEMTGPEKREAMKTLTGRATPIGVLAFDGADPVGWCSIAPRETYIRLERSRTMPRRSSEPTWTVLCFFVTRPHRGQGVTRVLLEGAVRYACDNGATVIEGYPHDTAGVSSTHRGHSATFKAVGFRQDDERWALEVQGESRSRKSGALASQTRRKTRAT